MKKIAILYQSSPAPSIDGIIKPMKQGGYSDSGADIAFSLKQNSFNLLTPLPSPRETTDLDWVFPDSEEGINNALEKKAEVLWLNTVLYKTHPIVKYAHIGLELIGQEAHFVDEFDDKWMMSQLLKKHQIPVPKSQLIKIKDMYFDQNKYSFPLVLKPIRGRGSQGVVLVHDQNEFEKEASNMLHSSIFGNKIYVETFLSGREITLTVMPPGLYYINKQPVKKNCHWCLPPVERSNHLKGVAPYSGNIAVINNSKVINKKELLNNNLQKVMSECSDVGKLLKVKAPIRIDCRANDDGMFYIFDVNLKPNLTGSSRPHRKNQDSLTTIAAKAIGWSYQDLLANIYHQKWAF